MGLSIELGAVILNISKISDPVSRIDVPAIAPVYHGRHVVWQVSVPHEHNVIPFFEEFFCGISIHLSNLMIFGTAPFFLKFPAKF